MSQTIHEMVQSKAHAAKAAMRKLSRTSSDVRNGALLAMADSLLTFKDKIREANQIDLENGRKTKLAEPLMQRLALDEQKIERMADNLRQVAALPDPIGEVTRMWERPNGLRIGTVRVPIGVVGVIYESRPDVTVEVSALCIKSGNGVILRGGSEAIHSNTALANILSETAAREGVKDAIQFVDITDRQAVQEMISMSDLIDLIVPRGSQEFIRYIMQKSAIPVVGHADGICHVYVDEAADLNMAAEICLNAKIGYKVAVCNAMETLLVHERIAPQFLPSMCEKLAGEGVELRGCEKTRQIYPDAIPAAEEDWRTEYLDKILSIRVVSDFDEAVDHIESYGSHHSDAIVTQDYATAQRFLKEVDSAAVYVNASTCFTDGYEFGLGAEVGISTQKLHCRGPMGLEGLTSYKYIIYGNGQVRT
ncbi:MAG: glutamate-5-semialdehyde dehydrogenase [Candidatus Poribacteria bacterium]|nr:glutamate-5-semialdehyde dehydrogenase [Candidatus Poribacteria bacterium]